MKPLLKLFLYPISVFMLIGLIAGLSFMLTLLFSYIFDCTLYDVAYSPMIVVYIITAISTIYLSTNVCMEIEKL